VISRGIETSPSPQPWIVLTSSRSFSPAEEKPRSPRALSELAQALSDLGLHEYASSVSGFALEILRVLYAADPYHFRSRLVSIQSLRANIFVDLGQNDDATNAADEAVTILKEHGDTQTELIYAMLNYAILLGSIGQGESAVAVAFELMEYIDDSTNIQPDISPRFPTLPALRFECMHRVPH
jgi:tetratricopeptide (TPR) repeat protein